MTFQGRTYWLVGASEGLGRVLAKQLAAEGAKLIVSARSMDRLEDLAADLPDARAVRIDVTDMASVEQAAEEVGPVDGLIYNAGAYDPMPATEWDTDKVLKMADVNCLGAVRVLGEVLPGFVARGAGDITLVGSLSGYRGLPKSVGYSASKAAIISLAETLRFDLKGTGVTVRVVNPGFIRTRLTEKNSFKMPMLMEPEAAASHVRRAMGSRRFRTDFPRPFSWAIRAFDYLPDAIAFRMG